MVGADTTTAARIDETEALLRQAANAACMFISGDSRVSEADAAALLGYSADHLAELRKLGKGPPAFRIGMNGARKSYRLVDIAAWIEDQRENCDGCSA
jgi:hypothetical protein